jgi:EmrB/QacA subfamily drug resistance transporter
MTTLETSVGTAVPAAHTVTGAVTGTVSDPTEEAISRHAWAVLAVSAAAVYVVFLDATIVNIAFPAISADFSDVTRSGLSWVLNAYAVVFGALLVTAGRLADDHGRKRVFLAGLGVFALGSVLCGFAPSAATLIAARVVQGVGGALLVPASLALLLPEFPLSKRATAVGMWAACGAIASATGPSIGALLIEGPGWRWVFFVNLPFCLAAVWFGRTVLVESKGDAKGRVDVLGVLLVTAVFGLLSLGLVQGGEWGWSSYRTVGVFVNAAVLAPVLVLRSLHHAHPAMPVRLFRVPMFSVATGATLLYGAAFFGQILISVLFLTGVWEYSILRTALAILPGPLMAAFSAPIAGKLADRHGDRSVVVPGAAFFAVGALLMATAMPGAPAYLTNFLPLQLLLGVSIGTTMSTLGAAASQALPPTQFGAGSAVSSAARQLGAVLGVALVIAVLGTPSAGEALRAFHHAWLTTAVLAAASTLVSLGLPTRTRA